MINTPLCGNLQTDVDIMFYISQFGYIRMVCHSTVCATLAAATKFGVVHVVLMGPLLRSLEFCSDQLPG